MKNAGKWIRIAAVLFCLLFAAAYLLVRPAAVARLEPLLLAAGEERINGTLSWRSFDLDPLYNLEFKEIELKDQNGRAVFRSPSLTVGWTVAGAFSAWKNGESVSAMVQDVILDRPELHFYENADGSWNVQTLLKPQKDEQPGAFYGRILLKDGTAQVALNGSRYEASGLEGQFSWMNKGTISAALSGIFADASFDAQISYENEKNFQAEVKTGEIPLTSLQGILAYLPSSAPEIKMKSGTVEVTGASVRSTDGVLAYEVKGQMAGAALTADDYELTDGKAAFTVADDRAVFSGAEVLVNGQRITGGADVSWKGETLVSGQASLQDADLSKLLPKEDAAGRLSGSVHVSGPVNDWNRMAADGRLALHDGHIRGVEIQEAQAQFLLKDGTAELSPVELKTGDGSAQASGYYRIGTGEFQLRAAADQLSLAPLEALLGVNGTMSGTLEAAGRWDGQSLTLSVLNGAAEGQALSWEDYAASELSADFSGDGETFHVRFYGSGLSGRGVNVDSVCGEAEGNAETWTLASLNGTMGGGAFSLRGRYDRGQMDLDVQAGGIEAEPAAELLGQDFGGKVSVSGTLSGTLERPVFNAEMAVMDGHFQKAKFSRLAGHLSSDGEWLTIHEASMDTATGRHTLEGRIGLQGDHALELTERSEHTRIENVLRLADIDAPLTGWFQNETTVTGTMQSPEITGRFMAWDGSVAGELYQSIFAEYRLDQEGEVRISNGLAYIYGGAAVLNGTVSAESLDLQAALVDVDIERILRGGPAAGRATFRGHISGSPSSPVFDGEMGSRRIAVNGAEIEQVSAGISYEDGLLRVSDGVFRQKNGQFRWSGLINLTTGALSGRLHFNGWEMEDALQFFQLSVSGITGSMNGGLVLQGTMENPSVALNVNIDGGHLGDAVMGDGKLNLSYTDGLLSIRECYLPVAGGLLAARGSVQNGGAVDLTVAANQMDISWIPQVLGLKDLTLGGQLTAGITLAGTLADPTADISVTVASPKYNSMAFDELSLMGNAGNGVFRIDQMLASKGIYKASARGTMPVSALTRVPDGRDIPFDMRVDLDNADLNALVFMLDSVTSASGPIRGHLEITGPWDDPSIQGGASVQDGMLTADVLSEPVTGIDGELVFSGKRAEFTGQAGIGGGTASAAVRAAWDHMQLSGYDGEMHIHAPAIQSPYYQGNLDADAVLSEERGMPKVTGTVDVADAVIDIPMSFTSGGGGADLLMDISVNVGDDVRLYNSLLYDLDVSGSIHAMGSLSHPLMSGRVDVERGSIKYLSNEFTVTEGTAVWGGVPDSFLPVLNVKANTSVGHYRVGMELKGPPGNFIFNLHSEPSLNDTQIVTLLTLRQGPGSTDNDAATGALFNAGLSMIFSGGVQDLIRNTFGLDLISVTSSLTDYYSSADSGLNNDYYYIKIGKYLFNDFMLTATMGVNNDEESYGFRYDLKSRVGLAAWYNNDHDSYVGADYQFQF